METKYLGYKYQIQGIRNKYQTKVLETSIITKTSSVLIFIEIEAFMKKKIYDELLVQY